MEITDNIINNAGPNNDKFGSLNIFIYVYNLVIVINNVVFIDKFSISSIFIELTSPMKTNFFLIF